MIGHHLSTGILGYLCLHPFVHGYIVFFGGVIEITNIPLTFMDIFKGFKSLQNVCRISAFELMVQDILPLFACMFYWLVL